MAKLGTKTFVKTAAAKAAMEQKIAQAAAKLALAAPSLASTKGKTYETWAMFELAARLAAYSKVQGRNSAGNPTTTFRVRGGPGHIPPKTAKAGKLPCYFDIPSSHPWWSVELHNSVEHVGLSGETHELDVSVISKQRAEIVRKTGGPYHGPTVVGVELKAYDEQTTLDKAIARALLGSAVDLQPGTVISTIKVELRSSPNSPYVIEYPHLNISLITTSHITAATKNFLSAYGIDAWDGVAPGQNESSLDTLTRQIREWL